MKLHVHIAVFLFSTAALLSGQSAGTASTDAPERWVIKPGRSVGPIRIGQSEKDLRASLGQPASKLETVWEYPSLGLSVAFKDGSVVSVIAGEGSPPPAARAKAFKPRTEGGAGMGSSVDEVTRALGPPDSTRAMSPKMTSMSYADGIDFLLFDGRVFNLAVHRPLGHGKQK